MYHIGEILVGKRVVDAQAAIRRNLWYALFRKHTPIAKQAEIKAYRFQSLVCSKKYAKRGGGGGFYILQRKPKCKSHEYVQSKARTETESA